MVRSYPKIFVYTAILLGVLILPLMADSTDDCVVSGKLQINGQDALPGTLLEAYIDGEKIVTTTTMQLGQYEITIPKYDASNPQVKGYRSTSDVVIIKANDTAADPEFNPSPGALKHDLQVKTTLNVKLTTWGKIKALFK